MIEGGRYEIFRDNIWNRLQAGHKAGPAQTHAGFMPPRRMQ